MFVLKIATTVWLTLIALGMVTATLNGKVAVSTKTSWCCGNARSNTCHSFHVAINRAFAKR